MLVDPSNYPSTANAGNSFNGEYELIEWAIANRSQDIEFTWFDKEYNVISKPSSLVLDESNAGEFELNGLVTNQGLYAVVAYDPAMFSYRSFSVDQTGIIYLAMNPKAGAVVFGIAPAGKPTAEFTGHLRFFLEVDRPIRLLSKAPSGDHNIVNDLEVTDSAGDWQLVWREKNLADYSNDGEVGIPDVTPIAQFFNVTVDHADPNDQAAIVDGDFSNEIGVSDITPIAQNYLNEVSKYYVFRWQPATNWEQIDQVLRPDPVSPAWLPPRYDYTDSNTAVADTFYAVRAVDRTGAVGVSSIVVGVPGSNQSVKPDPPDVVPEPITRVDLNVANVLPFSILTGESQQFDVVLDSATSNYVLALTSLGEPSTITSPVTISTLPTIVPSSLNPSIIEPTSEARLNIALERKAKELLKYGTRPKLVERKISAIGAEATFNIVFADFDPNTLDGSIVGVLRAENDRVRIWVDKQVDDSRFEPGQLDVLATETRDIALAQEEAAYGGIYDPDDDNRFDILFTPQINAIPGQVRGLFVTNDLQESIGTNTRDLIYLDVPDCTEGVIPGTYDQIPPGIFDQTAPISKESFAVTVRQEIAHELQHLLNYGNRLKIRDTHSVLPEVEETWLNEGLSHFTEDFVGYQSHTNYAMIRSFLEMNDVTPVIWPTSMDAPVPRGGVNLFVRYIYEQYGVNTMSKLLLRSTPNTMLSGIANLESATGDPVEDIYRNWLTTMSFIGWDVIVPNTYKYALPSTHPLTNGMTGIAFLDDFTDYAGITSQLPRPAYHLLIDDAISTFDLLPNAPVFLLINDDSSGNKKFAITAGTINPVYGVFVRVSDEQQKVENTSGTTEFEFFKLFTGEIEVNTEKDDYDVVAPSDGRVYVRVVSCIPNQLKPVISVQGNVQSDLNPMQGSALFYFNLTGGGGGLTFGVSSADGTTGKYLISAEFYPQ